MDRRSFLRSMLMAGGAVAAGAAILPREAQAASLLDTLKDSWGGKRRRIPVALVDKPC